MLIRLDGREQNWTVNHVNLDSCSSPLLFCFPPCFPVSCPSSCRQVRPPSNNAPAWIRPWIYCESSCTLLLHIPLLSYGVSSSNFAYLSVIHGSFPSVLFVRAVLEVQADPITNERCNHYLSTECCVYCVKSRQTNRISGCE